MNENHIYIWFHCVYLRRHYHYYYRFVYSMSLDNKKCIANKHPEKVQKQEKMNKTSFLSTQETFSWPRRRGHERTHKRAHVSTRPCLSGATKTCAGGRRWQPSSVPPPSVIASRGLFPKYRSCVRGNDWRGMADFVEIIETELQHR